VEYVWSDIAAINAMGVPGAALAVFFVSYSSCTRRIQRGTVIVKIAFDLGIHRDLGVNVDWEEQVQSDFTLEEEAEPQVDQEFWIDGGEAGDDMIFVGADGMFHGIAATAMWQWKLKINVFFIHVIM
jgi:hypothetical protein